MIIEKFYDQSSGDDVVQIRYRDYPPHLVLAAVERAVRDLDSRIVRAPEPKLAVVRPVVSCPMEIGEHDDHAHD